MELGDGPIQISPASMTAWAKSAFSERKPYPGGWRWRPTWRRRRDLVEDQVGLGRGLAAEGERLVGELDEECVGVRLRVHRDAGDTCVTRSPDHRTAISPRLAKEDLADALGCVRRGVGTGSPGLPPPSCAGALLVVALTLVRVSRLMECRRDRRHLSVAPSIPRLHPSAPNDCSVEGLPFTRQ